MNRLSERGQPCPHESSPRHSRTRLSALLSVAGSWSRCVILKSWRLPMNRTPSSRPSPPVGEKVPGGRLRGIPTGSWPQLTSEFWRCSLSMNRPLTPSLSPSDGERVAEGRVRGGPWSRCVRKSERRLSMNPDERPTSNGRQTTKHFPPLDCDLRYDDGMTLLAIREFHQRLNARFTELNGMEVVEHYGDPPAEHAALRETAGVLDLSFRSRLCLTGRDRPKRLK